MGIYTYMWTYNVILSAPVQGHSLIMYHVCVYVRIWMHTGGVKDRSKIKTKQAFLEQ